LAPWPCFDQSDATLVLKAELNATNYTAPTTVKTRLGTNAPTATSNMTELSGTGYTAGGTVMTWNTASAAATSNSSTATWTNGSGSGWSIVGLEIWDTVGPNRHLWGTWTGQPISIANTNSFQIAAAGIAVSLILCLVVCYIESMPRGPQFKLTSDQQLDVAERYGNGQSVRQIAAVYGVSYTPIADILKRQGIARRERTDYSWKPTPENCAEVVRLWREGLAVLKIAKQVQTDSRNVSQALRDAGIKTRYGGKNHRFKKDEIPALIKEYAATNSLAQMAKRYGCSTAVIRNTLQRNGVEILPYNHSPKFWTEERVQWLREQHEAGRSQEDIAREIGYTQVAVGRQLRDRGIAVPARAPRGSDSPTWNGGRTIDANGYVRILVVEDERHLAGRTISGGYVLEHRLVMARQLGRPLLKTETVHHINGDSQDNRPENLQLRQGNHGKGVVLRCADCGSHNVEAAPLT
jgi:transposase